MILGSLEADTFHRVHRGVAALWALASLPAKSRRPCPGSLLLGPCAGYPLSSPLLVQGLWLPERFASDPPYHRCTMFTQCFHDPEPEPNRSLAPIRSVSHVSPHSKPTRDSLTHCKEPNRPGGRVVSIRSYDLSQSDTHQMGSRDTQASVGAPWTCVSEASGRSRSIWEVSPDGPSVIGQAGVALGPSRGHAQSSESVPQRYRRCAYSSRRVTRSVRRTRTRRLVKEAKSTLGTLPNWPRRTNRKLCGRPISAKCAMLVPLGRSFAEGEISLCAETGSALFHVWLPTVHFWGNVGPPGRILMPISAAQYPGGPTD